MKRAWRLLLPLTAALSQGPGCATTAEVAKLRAELSELRAKQRQDTARLTDEITIAKHFTEFSLRQLSSRVECDNSRVREFLKSCEEGAEACSEQGLANALSFMDTQPYVMLFMRPGVGIQGLSNIRRGQLMTLGESKNWRPSTRFLVLVQPRSDVPEHREEALRLGRELATFSREELAIGKKYPILGPHMLPCKLKIEHLSHYSRRYDRPLAGEPTGKDPVVRMWLFRTDC